LRIGGLGLPELLVALIVFLIGFAILVALAVVAIRVIRRFAGRPKRP